MKNLVLFSVVLAIAGIAQASWYWPFGSDDEDTEPRVSELMEPASNLIDEAADFAAEGKVDEAVEKYRKALLELDRIELENPERAKSPEFATLRNKRAYVNAAIDSMLLSQVKSNARAVAVSDTTELEKKLAAEKAKARGEKTDEDEKDEAEQAAPAEKIDEASAEPDSATEEKPEEKPTATASKPVDAPKEGVQPLTKRQQAIRSITSGDYATAETLVKEMLAAKPGSAMALNLMAALEMKKGDLKAAEEALDQAISSNPHSYFAYYNMAMLVLQKDPDAKASAQRYYDTGRTMGGPANPELEGLLK